VLGTGLTADGPDREGRAVGLTFRDGDDRWCRTFRSGQAGMAGLACREDDRWTIRALAPAGADGGDLRTAAADIPAPVLAAVDAAIAGETLDAAAEVRARDAGWRRPRSSPATARASSLARLTNGGAPVREAPRSSS